MPASARVANGIGQPVRRKEDFRLLTGSGRFGDDIVLPRQAHAGFVRSPHAHAHIVAVDKRAALAAPGVLAVLTGADYVAEDVAERGIERNELINSAQPVARGAVAELLGRYDRVWYW